MLKLKFIKMENGIIKQTIHSEEIGKKLTVRLMMQVTYQNYSNCLAYGRMQQHHHQMRFTFLEEQLHRKIGHLGSSNFSMIG